MKRILLFSFLILSINYILAQTTYKRKISVTEWVQEMTDCKLPVYNLENVEINMDYNKDTLYATQGQSGDKKREINCQVELSNCKFPEKTFHLNNLLFKKHVAFIGCTMANMDMNNCEFSENVDLIWGNLGLLNINNTVFNGEIKTFEVEISYLSFDHCTFNVDNKKNLSYLSLNHPTEGCKGVLFFTCPSSSKKIDNLQIDSCQINSKDVTPVILFLLSDFKTISFNNTDFKNSILNFSACSVEKAFTVTDCKFEKPLGLENFSFPEKGTNFHWDQISKAGIAIYSEGYKKYYAASTDSQLTELNQYNELLSSYKQFHSIYRTRGDMESANKCYMAMKDVETRRLKYLYQQNKTLNNYFNWMLNRFLKFFCKYGTSPIRALIISLWTILAFGFIYFFFDNEWDRMNRDYFVKKYKGLISYFQSDKKISDYYTENHNIELNTYKEFSDYLKASSDKIPRFLVLLGKPLYRFSATRRLITTYIYNKVELLHGEWKSLNKKRKLFVNIVTSLAILGFIIYAIIVKALNSLFLSINTFSTLGFGKIPVTGLSKYLAILQGFIGWFLLSIFSVSLINQILQS